MARGHAVYCRRDVARVMMTLRVEFSDQDRHPVGRALKEALERVLDLGTQAIAAARKSGGIPSGPPDRVMALAYLGAVEGLVINLAGQEPFESNSPRTPFAAYSACHPQRRVRLVPERRVV